MSENVEKVNWSSLLLRVFSNTANLLSICVSASARILHGMSKRLMFEMFSAQNKKEPDIYAAITQVTVKSAGEKQQEKLARKEEKKLSKFAARELESSSPPENNDLPQFPYYRR